MTRVTAASRNSGAALELWGGIECTVHRVGDDYGDQLERSGHATRAGDIQRIAALGIRTLRYPFLWERTAPHGLERADWSWIDDRMRSLRRYGMTPIAGLVHHGSGPRHVSLLDDSFATGLASYAGAVARRYPEINAYTPVNEPGTTARFSALYGHWYPHARDDRSFVRAVLVQCRATVMAMRAIRAINPAARLVQTEDLGRTFSTPLLDYQAEFQNERRWLAFDLLCGRVTPQHPLWGYLGWAGATSADLGWFLDHRCPPDVVGVNYYLTSDRFLDHRLDRYPSYLHGGNGRHAYADTEAVRVRREGIVGHRALLAETFDRYHLPIALTEVHLGGPAGEQVCWLSEGWMGACTARAAGTPVQAVTAWALLGSFDWDSLLTRTDGSYEPGAFDVSTGRVRLTRVGRLIERLQATGLADTAREHEGWWRRPARLTWADEHARG